MYTHDPDRLFLQSPRGFELEDIELPKTAFSTAVHTHKMLQQAVGYAFSMPLRLDCDHPFKFTIFQPGIRRVPVGSLCGFHMTSSY